MSAAPPAATATLEKPRRSSMVQTLTDMYASSTVSRQASLLSMAPALAHDSSARVSMDATACQAPSSVASRKTSMLSSDECQYDTLGSKTNRLSVASEAAGDDMASDSGVSDTTASDATVGSWESSSSTLAVSNTSCETTGWGTLDEADSPDLTPSSTRFGQENKGEESVCMCVCVRACSLSLSLSFSLSLSDLFLLSHACSSRTPPHLSENFCIGPKDSLHRASVKYLRKMGECQQGSVYVFREKEVGTAAHKPNTEHEMQAPINQTTNHPPSLPFFL